MPGTSFSPSNWAGYDEQSATNPSAALTDFSLLIDISRLSSTWKSNVQSDGADIRLTKGDNTELAYDLIDWAYGGGSPTGLIRVLWSSTLATSGTQNVRVWAGYTGGTATAYGATETYGSDNAYDSNWVMYLPFGGDFNDRTSNSIDGTGHGSISAGGGTGPLGQAATIFDGVDDYVSGTIDAVHSDWTIMGHYRPDDTTTNCYIISHGNSGNIACIIHGYQDGYFNCFGVGYPTGTAADSQVADGGATTWRHIAYTKLDTSNELIGYSNASADIDVTISNLPSNYDIPAQTVFVGQAGNNSGWYPGQICDYQLHKTVRAAAWITEEYTQGTDQATFWGTWAWTAAGGATFSPTAGTLTLSGSAATVGILLGKSPTAGALTLSGSSPSVGVSRAFSITAGSLTLSGSTADVAVTSSGTINPSAVNLALSGSAAAVALSLGFSPAAGALALSGDAATVTPLAIVPIGAGGLTLTGSSATLNVGLSFSPVAGALALSGSAVQVEGGVSITLPSKRGGAAGRRRRIMLEGRVYTVRSLAEERMLLAAYVAERAPVLEAPETTKSVRIAIRRAQTRLEVVDDTLERLRRDDETVLMLWAALQ